MRRAIMAMAMCFAVAVAGAQGGVATQGAGENGGGNRGRNSGDNIGGNSGGNRGGNRFMFTTTLGVGFPVDGMDGTPVTWRMSGLRRLTDRWAVGVGTGVSRYGKALVPVFGDVRYRIGRERRLTPFAELAVGYSFAPSRGVRGGVLADPSIGVVYPLSEGLKLQLAVGCEIQKLERLRTSRDSYFTRSFTEKLSRKTLTVRLGLVF